MKKVFLKHLRPGYCWSGAKAFFERNGIDPDDFRRNGITVERLLATNDEMARKITERAIEVGDDDGQQQ